MESGRLVEGGRLIGDRLIEVRLYNTSTCGSKNFKNIPKAAIANPTTTRVILSSSPSHCDPLKLNRNVMIFLTVLTFTSSLVICMDIEVNPGPTSTPRFTSIFNTTKRIQLKLIRYQYHLKNYQFCATNNFVSQGLLPRCTPAFDSNNFWFYRQWRNICLIAARRHLTLLTKECRMKILYKELANHKKNLEEHCTSETFNFCGRQKEPAILISTLLLQTHAP